jgi:hypothetical protein
MHSHPPVHENARMISIFMGTGRLLRSTLERMATPCSANARA